MYTWQILAFVIPKNLTHLLLQRWLRSSQKKVHLIFKRFPVKLTGYKIPRVFRVRVCRRFHLR